VVFQNRFLILNIYINFLYVYIEQIECFNFYSFSRDGIAFSVGLDGPGIKSQWGEIFHTGPEAHQAAYTRDTRSLPGAKRPEHVVVHPPPSTAYVKKRVKLKFLLLLCSFMVGYMAKFIF
jgi:hypothetical protein